MILIEDRLLAARKHRDAGRGENALLIYQTVLDINPANREALKGAAETLIGQGRPAEALPLASQAVALAGADIEALKLLAIAAQQSQNHEREAAALQQAALIDPFDPGTASLRAATALRRGDLAECERILVDALRVHPDEAGLTASLSQTYLTAGLVADALEYSAKALALAPGNTEYIILRGSQLALAGDNSAALILFERAILADPGNVLLMAYLADSYASLGQITEAVTVGQRAVGLRTDVLPAWRAYAKARILRGEAGQALRQVADAARQHADRVEALITLADVYRLAGEHRQALQLLEPLAPRLSTLPISQRQAAAALQRDCRLSLGLVEQVGAAMRSPEAAAPGEDGPPPPVERHVAQTLLIGADMPFMEAMPLLRFRLQADGKVPTQVRGPAVFADIMAMMPAMCFEATDGDAPRDLANEFPLGAILALPEDTRGPVEMSTAYVAAPSDRRALWRQTFADLPRPLVALAWSATRPGLMLEDLAPALEGFEGTLVGVVWDEGRHQLSAMPHVLDAGVHFASMADLAAVLAEVDGILGCDGLPMHVAGAMGRPGAVLTQPNAPWYWCEKDRGTDNRALWYPSVNVLRTSAIGHWMQRRDDVMPAIGAFLGGLHSPDIRGLTSVALFDSAEETREQGEVA